MMRGAACAPASRRTRRTIPALASAARPVVEASPARPSNAAVASPPGAALHTSWAAESTNWAAPAAARALMSRRGRSNTSMAGGRGGGAAANESSACGVRGQWARPVVSRQPKQVVVIRGARPSNTAALLVPVEYWAQRAHLGPLVDPWPRCAPLLPALGPLCSSCRCRCSRSGLSSHALPLLCCKPRVGGRMGARHLRAHPTQAP
jgi:hypothetical protein